MRYIAHFDLDSFYVSVERLQNPELMGKPILIGNDTARGVVASCSYEARTFGIRSAMPMQQAKLLCPKAIIIAPKHQLYKEYSKIITDIFTSTNAIVEKASIDEHYLDISYLNDFDSAFSWCQDKKHKVFEQVGLPISFGLASNKTLAKIATGEGKPNGSFYILPGTEKVFLATLPINKIPLVGPKTAARLKSMQIQTISDLQGIELIKLIHIFGKRGKIIWERAHGIDKTPVKKQGLTKSVSKEYTFLEDSTDIILIQNKLLDLFERIYTILIKKNLFPRTVSIKLRFKNFETINRQSVIQPNHNFNYLRQAVLDIFSNSIKEGNLEKAIRLIGVRFSNFQEKIYQASLFKL